MADSLLLWVLPTAVFVSMLLLAVVCLRCRTKGPLVVRQANASEEYMPSTEFRVLHPSQPTIHLSSGHLSSGLLSPLSLPADAGPQRRRRAFTPTETESRPSSENPADGPDYINTESDQDDPGYIIVLPEGEAPLNNPSRPSTPSSDVLHDYENVPEKKEFLTCAEDKDYLNVELLPFQPGSTPDLLAQSDSDDDDDDEDSNEEEDDEDDDEEGNYVNQPLMIHSQPSA